MADRSAPGEQPGKIYRYKDIRLLSRAIMILAGVLAGVTLLSILFSYLEHDILQRIQSGESGDALIAEAEASDSRQVFVAYTTLGLYLAYGLLSCVWLYRGNANLHALGRRNLRFTPGWMIGWYLIPIANLFKPYQGMTELWQASATPDWKEDGSPVLLLGWWILTLLNHFIDRAFMQFNIKADSIDELLLSNEIGIASDLLSLPLLGLGLYITGAIMRFQIAAAEQPAATRAISLV